MGNLEAALKELEDGWPDSHEADTILCGIVRAFRAYHGEENGECQHDGGVTMEEGILTRCDNCNAIVGWRGTTASTPKEPDDMIHQETYEDAS